MAHIAILEFPLSTLFLGGDANGALSRDVTNVNRRRRFLVISRLSPSISASGRARFLQIVDSRSDPADAGAADGFEKEKLNTP